MKPGNTKAAKPVGVKLPTAAKPGVPGPAGGPAVAPKSGPQDVSPAIGDAAASLPAELGIELPAVSKALSPKPGLPKPGLQKPGLLKSSLPKPGLLKSTLPKPEAQVIQTEGAQTESSNTPAKSSPKLPAPSPDAATKQLPAKKPLPPKPMALGSASQTSEESAPPKVAVPQVPPPSVASEVPGPEVTATRKSIHVITPKAGMLPQSAPPVPGGLFTSQGVKSTPKHEASKLGAAKSFFLGGSSPSGSVSQGALLSPRNSLGRASSGKLGIELTRKSSIRSNTGLSDSESGPGNRLHGVIRHVHREINNASQNNPS
ncbi:hypothetical protein GNI_051080 [Gregarina niphandrodes]|uniref:Uncharacterized protein n=1 Tax=Gregarina niphandrodes TaxID=110365 RepID=A0A023B9C6_GRENI|nr:hypothetical protein GNI_051080 [Gregarina niphandrodes]EZG72688.1 hypothetical protein GNI_051080 [Gregarina niphandrodes]|eukprot:XP_011129772.1 hypothetical protein GNI_051080 [Gregarina niphandrodes]